MNLRELKKSLKIPANMKPSPTMRVQFADGKVIQMNRWERHRRGLYGDQVTKVATGGH